MTVAGINYTKVFASVTALSLWSALLSAQAAPAGSEWPAYNKNLDGQRYSPLSQINTQNVGSLKEVCRLPIARNGSFEAGPIVAGGTMYVSTSLFTIALDPVDCSVKWKHVYVPEQLEQLPVNRGVAILNGKVFRGTADARLLALDATTGKLVWSDVVGNADIGEYISGAPVGWNGLVFVGTAGGEFGIKGRIVAYDANSGREVWRFTTIPTGHDVGASTWRSKQWAEHGGGATWSSFAIDPATAELFVPVGNPAPDFPAGERPGSNLFTDSVVVLDARTGGLKWWYQLVPHDSHDYDLGAAPMLYRNNREQDVVALAGKDGYVHVVNRLNHALLFKTAVTTVDKEPRAPSSQASRHCPGAGGGVAWNGPALDREANLLFVGAIDACTVLQSQPIDFKTGEALFGGSIQPPTERGTGWVTALDATSGKIRWQYHADAPVLAGVTVTAGGLLFTGDNDGNFYALASLDGKLLKKIATAGSLSGGVITYQQSGRQYVAFASGNVSRTLYGALGRPTLVIMGTEMAKESVSSVPNPENGKQVYLTSCAACHSPDGSNIAGFNLRGLHNRMTEEQLTAWLLNPAPPMPHVFPTPLDDEDTKNLRDVVAYVLGTF